MVSGGQESTGQLFVGGGDRHPDTLQLQLRLLCSGIICRDGCSQAGAAQQTHDQFRFRTAW